MSIKKILAAAFIFAQAIICINGHTQNNTTDSLLGRLLSVNSDSSRVWILAELYHGLRAKDNSFNATIKTDFDENIGKIKIIPQDIGRVLLNFYNNAFYTINEKKNQAGNGYEPSLSVSTKNLKDKVEIRIVDNGNGIPQDIIEKIFQPFFTTKPTGQGTGLGLPLSYDIVKTHGGDIKVDSKEGEDSSFIIQLQA